MPEVSTASVSQPFFDEMVHFSPIATYTCNKEGYITWYNQAAVDLWGRMPEIGKDLWCGSWKIYHPNGQPMNFDECPMALTLKSRKPHEQKEIRVERPDHSFKNLIVYPRPVFDNEDKLIGAINTLVDITEQKKGEEKQFTLSAIVESSDDAIISKDLNGFITSWNEGARRIFGYKEEEILGKHITILIPPPLRAEEDVIIKNIKSGKKIDHFRTIRLTKDGRELPISITVSPVKDSTGNIIGASKIARDIHEQLLRENEIRLANQRLEILNSLIRDISGKLDKNAILQKVTDATTKLTGAAFGAFFHNTTVEQGEAVMLYALSDEAKEAFEKLGIPLNTAVFQPSFSGENVVRIDDLTKDLRYRNKPTHKGLPKGHLPVVSYLAVPVVTPGGTVLGGLFFGHPEAGIFKREHENILMSIAAQVSVILENNRLFEEVSMLNAKKDEFIALASHEMKTPLTILKGYLQLLEKDETNTIKKMFLEKSVNQVNKLNALIAELFDVSRIEAGKLQMNYEQFDFRKMILDLIETFRHTNESHRIIFDESGKDFIVEADKQRIEQVVSNLLTNAIKYSPGADKVYLYIAIENTELVLKVRDEGIGISNQHIKNIFTRFYRAAPDKNISGLGLGLYLSKEIIDRHGGTICGTSELGNGSEFCFSIPVNQKPESI